MFDIRWIRENPEAFDEGLAKRGLPAQAAELIALDAERRAVQTRLQEVQTRRNEVSKLIGQARAAGEDAEALIAETGLIKQRIQDGDAETKALTEKLEAALASSAVKSGS